VNALGRLAEFAVRRWQFTVLLFLMCMALGVASWFAIPRAEDPDFPVPIFTTVAVYPGASPEDMEQLVTEPIEQRLNALEDVKELRSTSRDGLSVIMVEFTPNSDAERKYDQVVREVNALRPELPPALQRLETLRNQNSDLSIFQLALVAPALPYGTLDEIAERFERALARAESRLTSGVPLVLDSSLREFLLTLRAGRSYPRRFLVRATRGSYFVRADEVDWVDAQENYVRLHAGGRAHLVRETMTALEQKLDPETFVRVHRSAIVNIDRIERIEPHARGEYAITLRDGTRLTSSRAHSGRLRELLK